MYDLNQFGGCITTNSSMISVVSSFLIITEEVDSSLPVTSLQSTYSLVGGTYGIRTLPPDHLVVSEKYWVWVVSETQTDPVGKSIHY